jgi:predicted Zn-dependent protease
MTRHRLSKPLILVFSSMMCFDTDIAVPENLLPVLGLLRHTHPDLHGLLVAEAQLHLRAKRYKDARHLLEDGDVRYPGIAEIKATLAMTLFMQRDALWEAYANEARALQPEDGVSEMLATLDKLVQRLRTGEGSAENAAPDLPQPRLDAVLLGVRC